MREYVCVGWGMWKGRVGERERTFVELATERGCEAARHVFLAVHDGFNQVLVFNDECNLRIAVTLYLDN